MLVSGGNETVRASQGSYCWDSTAADGVSGTSQCADYAYPLHFKCRLGVKPHGLVKIDTQARARTVSASLIRAETLTDTRYLDWKAGKKRADGKRVWRFRLPGNVGDAIALELDATYARGDSNAQVGLRTRACG
jgi:hypothetical protein